MEHQKNSAFDISSSIQTLTVGTGVSPVQSLWGVADFTADREFPPALKKIAAKIKKFYCQQCDLF